MNVVWVSMIDWNRGIKENWNNLNYPATRTYLTTFHLNINPPCFYPNGYSGCGGYAI